MARTSGLATALSPEPKTRLNVCDNLSDRIVDWLCLGIDNQFGCTRRFIRCRDSGEIGQLAAARLLVKALRVAILAGTKIGLYVNLVELLARRAARPFAVCAIG